MDDLSLIRLFTRTSKDLRAAGAAALGPHGIVLGQNLMLDELWERDGQTPGELAQRLGISGPTAVRMAQRIEDAGLVTRRRDDPDGRLVRVYLTDRGRALRRPVQRDLKRLHRQALAGLSPAEREQFARTLQVILGNVEELRPARRGTRSG